MLLFLKILLPFFVAEPEKGVDSDHQHIEDVKVDDIVEMVEKFVGDTGGIADKDDEEKADAFPSGLSRGIGPVDGKRPGGAETYQHSDFEDAHSRHFSAHPENQQASGKIK